MNRLAQRDSGLVRPTPGLWPGAFFFLVPAALGLLFLVALGFGVASGNLSGYVSTSPASLVLGGIAGAGLVVVGAVGHIRSPGSSTGFLATGLGAAWLAREVIGWGGGPALVRTLASAVSMFLLPVLLHLGFSYPDNQIRLPGGRRVLLVAYALALLTASGRLLFYDPFLDLHCWRTCAHNPLVPFPDQGLAAGFHDFWLVSSAAIGLLSGVIFLRYSTSQPRRARSWAWYVQLPVGLVVVAVAVSAGVELIHGFEDPEHTVFRTLFLIQSTALIGLWLGTGWGIVRVWRATRLLRTLARDLAEAQSPGGLQEILAHSLGDASLEVAYGLGEGQFVNASGDPIVVAPEEDQAVTIIERAGEELGVVVHKSTLAIPDLRREIGAAARLAIDNERLRAGILARVSELRASQRELVRTSDAARNQIERNLHDGAQQRLLALSYELRLAVTAARRASDPTADELETALESVLACLNDVREIAHGIFPSILTDAGLGPALSGLAETASLPVGIDVAEGRYPAEVEMAAYILALEFLEQAGRVGAGVATISSAGRDGALVMEATIDRPVLDAEELRRSWDRVGATGGELRVSPDRLTAVLPCG